MESRQAVAAEEQTLRTQPAQAQGQHRQESGTLRDWETLLTQVVGRLQVESQVIQGRHDQVESEARRLQQVRTAVRLGSSRNKPRFALASAGKNRGSLRRQQEKTAVRTG